MTEHIRTLTFDAIEDPETSLDDLLFLYRENRRAAEDYRAEYAPMLNLLATMEGDVAAIQRAICGAMTRDGLKAHDNDDFRVTLVVSDRGGYDASRLPKTAAVFNACEMTIRPKEVERLIRRGELTEAQAQAAFVSRRSAPYVRITPVTETAE